eukprot:1186846-Prorocentrum_minimum.AAC.2
MPRGADPVSTTAPRKADHRSTAGQMDLPRQTPRGNPGTIRQGTLAPYDREPCRSAGARSRPCLDAQRAVTGRSTLPAREHQLRAIRSPRDGSTGILPPSPHWPELFARLPFHPPPGFTRSALDFPPDPPWIRPPIRPGFAPRSALDLPPDPPWIRPPIRPGFPPRSALDSPPDPPWIRPPIRPGFAPAHVPTCHELLQLRR